MTTTNQSSQITPVASAVPERSPTYAGASSELLQATALNSFRYENRNNQNNNAAKPELIHIASSNVLVDSDIGYTSSPVPLSPRRPNAAPIDVAATPYGSTQHIPTAMSFAPRTFRGRLVKEKDAHLPDSILAYKRRRQTGTALATWACASTGLVLLGPYGAFVGGYLAYGVSKSLGKARERRLIRNYQTAEQIAQQHLS